MKDYFQGSYDQEPLLTNRLHYDHNAIKTLNTLLCLSNCKDSLHPSNQLLSQPTIVSCTCQQIA
ncbi:hypothetical protein ACTXT7_003810 [Hymenolepis weldensis]